MHWMGSMGKRKDSRTTLSALTWESGRLEFPYPEMGRKKHIQTEKFSLVFGYLKFEMPIRLLSDIVFGSTNLEGRGNGHGVIHNFDSLKLKAKGGLLRNVGVQESSDI